jgi:hypothetical protein
LVRAREQHEITRELEQLQAELPFDEHEVGEFFSLEIGVRD